MLSFSSKVKNEIANTKSEGCPNRQEIQAAYLEFGTMTHPRRAYHMEFAVNSESKQKLIKIFELFNLKPKQHLRKTSDILYFKEAEQIATILNIMGAHVALMEFENCRVGKDVNNSINRAANAAAANEDKVVTAAARHIRDIMDIQAAAGLGVLGVSLAQVAQIRLDNPLASLEEIGQKLTPPISKSGVNHRLKKIAKIAENYKNNLT